jgi:hypothetical protein
VLGPAERRVTSAESQLEREAFRFENEFSIFGTTEGGRMSE